MIPKKIWCRFHEEVFVAIPLETKVRVIKLSRERPTRNVSSKNLIVRKKGVTGTMRGWVGGYNCEVLLVEHDDSGDIGAYWYDEIEAIT
jgi:hypothetical protein